MNNLASPTERMNNNHLYRQEYIRLLWVHTQQLSHQTAKADEQRRALKVRQQRKLRSLNKHLDLVKRLYLTIRHFSEMNAFNNEVEDNRARLLKEQQEEIKRLKSSWEMKFSLNKAHG